MDLTKTNEKYKIDIGCGSLKKEGFIGIDMERLPGVDYVIDLSIENIPLPDNSVEYVYSSHFLEHIKNPRHLLAEIGRVCCDGAIVEIWTPYAFHRDAVLYSHEALLTPEIWYHFCVKHHNVWTKKLNGRWLLTKVNYTVTDEVIKEIEDNGFSLDFAIKYFKDVVCEFAVYIEIRKNLEVETVYPKITYSTSRYSEQHSLGSKI